MTFEPGCLQSVVFKQSALPIIESVLEGYNGTIFAYGQTGTGKTFTMEGVKTEEELKGIIPRTFEHIINAINGTVSFIFRHPQCAVSGESFHVRALQRRNRRPALSRRTEIANPRRQGQRNLCERSKFLNCDHRLRDEREIEGRQR